MFAFESGLRLGGWSGAFGSTFALGFAFTFAPALNDLLTPAPTFTGPSFKTVPGAGGACTSIPICTSTDCIDSRWFNKLDDDDAAALSALPDEVCTDTLGEDVEDDDAAATAVSRWRR